MFAQSGPVKHSPFGASSQITHEINARRRIKPLSPHAAAKVRAAHRLPSFAAAIESVYHFFRQLLAGQREGPLLFSLHGVHVTANPVTHSFWVEVSGVCTEISSNIPPVGMMSVDCLRDLASLSRSVRLCVSVEPLACLFDAHWAANGAVPNEEDLSTAWMQWQRRLLQRLAPHASTIAVHLRCDVESLFYCLPVRSALGAWRGGGAAYRWRAARESLVAVLYRIAMEYILAPLYFFANVATDVEVCLHVNDSRYFTKGLTDEHSMHLLRFQTAPLQPDALLSRGCRTTQKILTAFLHFMHHNKSGAHGSLFSSPPLSISLREVVVEDAAFIVFFPIPPHTPLPNTVVVAQHCASMQCYTVDESHRIHRHIAQLSATLRPLVVLLTDTILEGSERTLRRCIQASLRDYYQRNGDGRSEGTDARCSVTVSSSCVVPQLLAGPNGKDTASAALRVALLTNRIASTKSQGHKHARAVGGPRRTPFCPLKWGPNVGVKSTLSRVRGAVQVVFEPNSIVPRVYTKPTPWTPPTGDTPHEILPGCPFDATHVVAQWDQKFIILLTEKVGGAPSESMSSSQLPSALYLADQHAIHERLRLEYFITHVELYVQHPSAPATSPLIVPLDLYSDVLLYNAVLIRWGWYFAQGNKRDYNKTTSGDFVLFVTAWPKLVVEGHELVLDGIEVLRTVVEELITVAPREGRNASTETVGSTNSTAPQSMIPSVVLNFLVTRSCRGAVMFGDTLTPKQSRELIAALKCVQQYHRCSHGRPSLAALCHR